MTDILINAYGTHRQPPELSFPHRSAASFDRSSEVLMPNLRQFKNFCLDHGKREWTPTLDQISSHIDRVRHHFSFEIRAEDFSEIVDWAWEANAILLLPDGTVRDPAGNVLIDPMSGLPDDQAALPFPRDARQRKANSELLLRNRLIEPSMMLPPIVSEVEVKTRTPDEVAWRCLALFLVVVRSDSMLADRPFSSEKLRQRAPLGFQSATPIEAEFLSVAQPSLDQAQVLVWRYEALFTLQWALGIHGDLGFPDENCDTLKVAEPMLQTRHRDFVSAAKLRSIPELLDAADFNYRLLRAAREAAEHDHPPPGGADGSIALQRQHALNWLLRFGDADWDDVDTPT